MSVPLLALLTLTLAAAAEPARVERRLPMMGTVLSVTVEAADRGAALAASERAIRALEEGERRLSTWRDDSELARLNRAPVGEAVALSPALAAELAAARRCWRATGGAFDPGVGALVEAWGLRHGGRVPSAGQRRRALAAGGMAALELGSGTARRLHPGLRLEEGGFGKGAALDAARAVLAGLPGPLRAALDLGGQVAFHGPGPWRVEVDHPGRRGLPVVVLTVDGGSVATSGNSERAIEVEGKRRAHLLDPQSGEPVADFGSLTVVTAGALAADCLATGLYVLGPRRALAWAEADPAVELLVLEPTATGLRATATSGLGGRLEPASDDLRIEILNEAAVGVRPLRHGASDR